MLISLNKVPTICLSCFSNIAPTFLPLNFKSKVGHFSFYHKTLHMTTVKVTVKYLEPNIYHSFHKGMSFPFLGGAPLICAGRVGSGAGSDRCRGYYGSPFNEWLDYGIMYGKLAFPAHSYSENLGLVIIGGKVLSEQPTAVSNVVLRTDDARFFDYGPPLPQGLHR